MVTWGHNRLVQHAYSMRVGAAWKRQRELQESTLRRPHHYAHREPRAWDQRARLPRPLRGSGRDRAA
eukprot:3760899-Pleurochrysis_carterae.AAC.6